MKAQSSITGSIKLAGELIKRVGYLLSRRLCSLGRIAHLYLISALGLQMWLGRKVHAMAESTSRCPRIHLCAACDGSMTL